MPTTCSIPKVFYLDKKIRGMKLTKTKLLETIRLLNDGKSKYQARKIAGITKQRVYQVWNEYLNTGELPEIGSNMGRPKKPIQEWEIDIIREMYTKYRVSADSLERLIRRDQNIRISHNRIHKIMVQLGYATPKEKKDVRKKVWIRYERRHSLTAVHIDWHQRSNDGIWILAIEDDASRKLLVLIECDSPTVETTIEGMELALEHGKILQCISDHGSQFTSNIGGDSRFKAWLEAHSILQILCRIKHPQSNGKVEKWFDTYERHRDAFTTKEEFMFWYNEIRPHRSLNFEELETPQLAFIRKMKVEV